jgi:hypothetical protein
MNEMSRVGVLVLHAQLARALGLGREDEVVARAFHMVVCWHMSVPSPVPHIYRAC